MTAETIRGNTVYYKDLKSCAGMSPTLQSNFFYSQIGCAELSGSFGPRVTHLLTKEGKMTIKGQAQDMFSRIFRIRIYEFFLPNICNYLHLLKTEEKVPFLTDKEFVFFFELRNIGEIFL